MARTVGTARPSLFGPTDDSDRRRWQHRNLLAVTEMVKAGEKSGLAPLDWRLPTIGTVTGSVHSPSGLHPRTVFEAWFAALTAHPRIAPGRGAFRSGAAHHFERTSDTGQTRLLAPFELSLPVGPCEVCLLAEWFEDDYSITELPDEEDEQ